MRKYVTSAYLNITKEEANAHDRKLNWNGFANRTEYFTACVHITLYGRLITGEKTLHPQVTNRITDVVGTCSKTTEKLQQAFIELLHELTSTVIATHGGDATLTLLAEDLRTKMYERTRNVLIPAEIEN